MSGPLLCRNDTQCRPRFGDIWRCRRHVGDTSATCRAKAFFNCGNLVKIACIASIPSSWPASQKIRNSGAPTTDWHSNCPSPASRNAAAMVSSSSFPCLMRRDKRNNKIGFDGFLDEDAYLGECNLGDLEITSGKDEQYWLLAVKAAREAAAIEGRKRKTTASSTTS